MELKPKGSADADAGPVDRRDGAVRSVHLRATRCPANGGMLAAQQHFYPGGLQAPGSQSFDLTKGLPNAKMPVPLASNMTDDWGFSAVYPDGTFLLTCGEPADSTAVTGLFPVNNVNNPGMLGIKTNAMYDTSTGSTITFKRASAGTPRDDADVLPGR